MWVRKRATDEGAREPWAWPRRKKFERSPWRARLGTSPAERVYVGVGARVGWMVGWTSDRTKQSGTTR